eukprot:Skav212706  [mRNA]  locus=scaffold1930:439932:441012:+ [translate_table: standard]
MIPDGKRAFQCASCDENTCSCCESHYTSNVETTFHQLVCPGLIFSRFPPQLEKLPIVQNGLGKWAQSRQPLDEHFFDIIHLRRKNWIAVEPIFQCGGTLKTS